MRSREEGESKSSSWKYSFDPVVVVVGYFPKDLADVSEYSLFKSDPPGWKHSQVNHYILSQ